MPDLGNLATLTVSLCSTPLKPPDPNSVVPAVTTGSDSAANLKCPIPAGNCLEIGREIKVFRRRRAGAKTTKKASNGKTLDDHVRAWAEKKMEAGVSESRCSLPFLVGAKKMVECLACRAIIYPGEEVKCSVRGCCVVYHVKCVKDKLKNSILKKFKCPQHACVVCNRTPVQWRCMKCTCAWHNKCAPWADGVIHLNDQQSQAICWRHNPNWLLDWENEASISNIEEIFCRLPLPYTCEEFKIDLAWIDIENSEPPPYLHIKRNIYLVKKKRDNADDGSGCTSCSTECSQSCECRVQCISCSKACNCSDDCKNRPFRKEKKTKIVKTELCGWGVVAAECIGKGDFVVEYIGEVIDDAECEKRLWDMKHKDKQNFYMCELRKDFTIDATYKGNTSRFLNHGCDPNCVLEKWQVDGETRVGVFAAREIQVGEPLTYDYRFVQFGPEVTCHCGASNCQGYLGTKKKIENKKLRWGTKRKRDNTACTAIVTVQSNPGITIVGS